LIDEQQKVASFQVSLGMLSGVHDIRSEEAAFIYPTVIPPEKVVDEKSSFSWAVEGSMPLSCCKVLVLAIASRPVSDTMFLARAYRASRLKAVPPLIRIIISVSVSTSNANIRD